jgi:hypothetical protein
MLMGGGERDEHDITNLTDLTVIGGRKETWKGSEPLAVSRIVTGRLSGTDTYKWVIMRALTLDE